MTEPTNPAASRVRRITSDRRRINAPAKINLTLSVSPPAGDGYHPLDSIVVQIDFCDELMVTARRDGQLACRVIGGLDIPAEDNLVVKAARLIQQRAPGAGADIQLEKHIPPGAGLGGGSSDAAAALLALNDLWKLNLPAGDLAALAGQLGADVPLFLGPACQRMTGRGEITEPIDLPEFAVLLICPPIHSDTAGVYRQFDAMGCPANPPGDPAGLAAAPLEEWDDLLVNDLRAPAEALQPGIADWAGRAATALGRAVHMTGSGSALFVLAGSADQASRLREQLPGDIARVARVCARC